MSVNLGGGGGGGQRVDSYQSFWVRWGFDGEFLSNK